MDNNVGKYHLFTTLLSIKGFWSSVYKRKDKKGKVTGWRAVVRMKGYPTVYKEFERKQEADDWKLAVTRKIKAGNFNLTNTKFNVRFLIWSTILFKVVH
jgi:hypothetical protein